MNASDPAGENTSIGRGPTIRREMSAGLTTFLTMAYIVFVQPVSCCYAPVSAGDSQAGKVKSQEQL